MKEIIGNIWDYASKNTVVCILTNNTLNSNKKNPMGAGIALEAVQRNPGLSKLVYNCIINNQFEITNDTVTGAVLYRFPTKKQVWLPSDLDTIEESLENLTEYVEFNPTKTILLPRPGCGYGGLDWDTQVEPLVEEYLGNYSNVFIFSK